MTQTHSQYSIAIIEPLRTTDYGYDWGTKRRHTLLIAATLSDLAQRVRDYCESDTLPHATLDDCVAAVRVYWDDRATVHATHVDSPAEMLTDWLPSCGDARAWPCDIYIGLADYRSYLAFRAEAARLGMGMSESQYTLTSDTADACVRASGRDAVETVIDYLDELDPVRAILVEALARSAPTHGCVS